MLKFPSRYNRQMIDILSFFSNSSDDIEDLHYTDERRKVPPITANSHLHCHASTLYIPNEAFYANADPKTQK